MPLAADDILILHNQVIVEGQISPNPIETSGTSVRYCYPYITEYENCLVNNFADNDFRYAWFVARRSLSLEM